jgi:hypothetical protein
MKMKVGLVEHEDPGGEDDGRLTDYLAEMERSRAAPVQI